ncbi:Gag-Pol polyprotein [Nosema granulosis]|uniref:Gag-Pol polyprotein n=1 Tax=Nosema granulosis TaxID=83296 RepID=A0A9P6KY95_9MICR|nr:Gag-Pol polyprotein [Nosema granulosis]
MILVVIDLFSRWSELIIIKRITTKTIIQVLEEKWFNKFGTPKSLISDQGRQFISSKFSDFLASNNVKHIMSSSYNPTGNSIVERINHVIGNSLRCLKDIDFKNAVAKTAFALKHSYHQILGTTPYQVVTGTHTFNPLINGRIKHQDLKLRKKIRSTQDLERRNKARVPYSYKRGSLVVVKNHDPAKMEQRWLGPYTLLKVRMKKNYVIVEIDEQPVRVNLKRIRPFQKGVACHVLTCNDTLYACFLLMFVCLFTLFPRFNLSLFILICFCLQYQI